MNDKILCKNKISKKYNYKEFAHTFGTECITFTTSFVKSASENIKHKNANF